MKKNLFIVIALLFATFVFSVGCNKNDSNENTVSNDAEKYSADVATDWFTLETEFTKSTPGFGPGISGRAFAYSGLALYEAVVTGMPGYQPIYAQLSGKQIVVGDKSVYYWPACANAALAASAKKFFAATTAENLAKIDKLEADKLSGFQGKATPESITLSVAFGKMVGDSIFSWSASDGGLPPFPVYIPVQPVTPGLWEPTPPAFAPGVTPNLGDVRTFVTGIANELMPPAPTAYSEDPASDFYKMVKYVYDTSTRASASDIALVNTWGDNPGNYNGHTHLTKVLTQLIIAEKFDLAKAAAAYAQHGMAINDATIACFKAKYKYKLVRPVTYVRKVMGLSAWNTIIPTPPHPEYPAAHAAISGASATILRYYFGDHYAFTDHVHESLYGAKSYASIDEYEAGSGWSRVLGGLHYVPSVNAGLVQGRATGNKVLALHFKK
ncbi:MAG: vanadium-dependent haloperoxidase [Chitinophagaceae bacterium]